MHTHLNVSLRAIPIMVVAIFVVVALSKGAPALAQEPNRQDLRALIYYWNNEDKRSVDAELRQLRLKFPQWIPPEDLSKLSVLPDPEQTVVDERPIWARIERQDFAGARKLIADVQTRFPSYRPSPDMIRILEENDAQASFDQAYAQRDLNTALAAVRRTPSLVSCDRVNNAWRLAELYKATNQRLNAVDTYRAVLLSCREINYALSTLEKANNVADWSDMTSLFDLAREKFSSNVNTFDELQKRLSSGRGASSSRSVAPAVSKRNKNAPSSSEPRAASSPKMAAAKVSTAAVNFSQLPARGDARIVRVRALKERGDWSACLAASVNPRSVEVLYDRSWCAYNLDRSGEALAGFSAVKARGNVLGEGVSRDTQFGMILSYLAMNMTEEGARLATSTALTPKQRVTIETAILDQRSLRAFHRREFSQSIVNLNALEKLQGTLSRGQAMLRAYAYLNNSQREQARNEFLRLHQELATKETKAALFMLR